MWFFDAFFGVVDDGLIINNWLVSVHDGLCDVPKPRGNVGYARTNTVNKIFLAPPRGAARLP